MQVIQLPMAIYWVLAEQKRFLWEQTEEESKLEIANFSEARPLVSNTYEVK